MFLHHSETLSNAFFPIRSDAMVPGMYSTDIRINISKLHVPSEGEGTTAQETHRSYEAARDIILGNAATAALLATREPNWMSDVEDVVPPLIIKREVTTDKRLVATEAILSLVSDLFRDSGLEKLCADRAGHTHSCSALIAGGVNPAVFYSEQDLRLLDRTDLLTEIDQRIWHLNFFPTFDTRMKHKVAVMFRSNWADMQPGRLNLVEGKEPLTLGRSLNYLHTVTLPVIGWLDFHLPEDEELHAG